MARVQLPDASDPARLPVVVGAETAVEIGREPGQSLVEPTVLMFGSPQKWITRSVEEHTSTWIRFCRSSVKVPIWFRRHGLSSAFTPVKRRINDTPIARNEAHK